MNIQERIEALETEFAEKIKALKAEAQQVDEFPQVGDEYWRIDDKGSVDNSLYNDYYGDHHRQAIGNFFKTEKEAEFAVKKLKVEAELRKFSKPFEPMTDNFFMIYDRYLGSLENNCSLKTDIQGVIYFGSREEIRKAAETVGIERIKKYIFGVED